MNKLILTLLIIFFYQQEASSQNNPVLIGQHQKFKILEIEQMESEIILQKSIRECLRLDGPTGKIVARDYIEFARNAIRKWEVALENPDVLFVDMTTLEMVEMIKSQTSEDKEAETRIEELREKLREKIREHIRILSEDIRELTL